MSWKKAAMVGLLALWGTRAAAIDVVSMYRGSCQVDTGVVLRVDSKTVIYLGMDGVAKKIPRFEIVGVASYPLPWLPVAKLSVPRDVSADMFELMTYRDGGVVPLAAGWPIEFNAEYIQMLTNDGKDHLVARNDIWGVRRQTPKDVVIPPTKGGTPRYKLRHPLAFEKCADNITPGDGEPVAVIPQTTYDNPITIKRHHDHLRQGLSQIEDYEDRQRFYAVPQYYRNRTLLGTWFLVASRYANVGARQANFLPLVQDELSEGPFGFQRVVRSGVAPLAWGLHEEPTVQVFYGLKADYVHLEVFFDPTSPLIGPQYNYQKGQLNAIDDRLVEKGGLEFGFDFGLASVFFATSEGNVAFRVKDFFEDASFGLLRTGLSIQYDYFRAGFYLGSDNVAYSDHLKQELRFAKLFASGNLRPTLKMTGQVIRRELRDRSDNLRPALYHGQSDTLAIQTDFDLSYRWTVYSLFSLERQKANGTATASGDAGSIAKLWPKMSGGATVTF